MRSSWRVVPYAVALIALPGCLTPSMGRKTDRVLGGHPSRLPLSARDAPTSVLVGRSFNWAKSREYSSGRVWELDSRLGIYYERNSTIFVGKLSNGKWAALDPQIASRAVDGDHFEILPGQAPEQVELALDGYMDRVAIATGTNPVEKREPGSTSPPAPEGNSDSRE